MQWNIKVSPTNADLDQWIWTAQREDGETYLVSQGDLFDDSAEALASAKASVLAHERRIKKIESHRIEENYTPTDEEIGAGL